MMQENSIKVLLIEDSESDALLLRESLAAEGAGAIELSTTISLEGAREFLQSNHVDAVLLDLTLPDSAGLETLGLFRQSFPSMPVVVLTGLESEKTGVDAVRMGAQDYLVKGQSDARLISRAVHYAIERKAAEEALRTSEARFRSVLDNSRDAVVRYNLQTNRYEYASPSVEFVAGYSPGDFLAMDAGNALAMVHPEDLPTLLAAQDRSLTAGQAEAEYRQRTRKGDYVWISNRMSVVKDGNGLPLYRDFTIRDITERKHAEQALRESEEKYRRLFEAAKDGILILDFNTGLIVDANKFLIDLLEYSYDEILQKHLWDIGIFKDVAASKDAFTQLQKKEYIRYENLPLETKNGKKMAVEFVSNAYFVDHRKVIQCNVRDITERRRAELALEKTVSRLDLLSRTAGELLQAAEPQKHVESLCRRVMEHLDCHVFFNFLKNDKADRLRLNAFAGIPEEEAKKIEWLDYGTAVCGCAARDACRIVAERIPTTSDPRTELVKSLGVKAYACHPIFGEGGEVLGTLSFGTRSRETFSDDDLSLMKAVTDQVATALVHLQAEEELRQSEERFRALSESSPVGMGVVSFPEGTFLYVNPAYEKAFGYSRDELLGRKSPDIWWEPAEREKVVAILKERGVIADYEVRLKRKDGSMFWGLASNKPITYDRRPATLGTFVDITERKRIEEDLRQSEDRFKAVASHTPDHILMQDRDLRYTMVINPQLGLTEKDMVGKTDHDFLAGQDAEKLTAMKRQVIESGKPMKVESSLVSKSGGLEYFDGSYVPVFDAAGTCDGLIGYFRNVTARKKQEDQLRKLNQALKALSRSSQAMAHARNESEYLKEICGIVVEDCGYKMVWIGFAENDEKKSVRPAEYAGFEEGYLQSLDVTWADTERGRGPTGTAIRTGKPCICRNMLTDPVFAPWREAAVKRGYASSIVLPLMADEKAFGAINIYATEPEAFSAAEVELLSELANDLSYGIMAIRMRAELDKTTEILRSERNFSNAVIQTTGGLIVGMDTEGRIKIFNHACEKTTGYTFDDVQGRTLWDFLLVPEEKEQVREVFKDIVKGSVTAETEFENYWLARDGERRYIRWANSALHDENGNVTLVIGTGIDITERQVIEEQLRIKAVELIKANQELEAFAYSVSHDLRNPLHSMVGCIDVLKDYSAKLDKDFATAVGHIERSSQRMSDIISDLLLLSRIARQEVVREKVNIGAMARAFAGELARESPQRGVKFVGMSDMSFLADPGLARILVENLLRNSWKFTSKKRDAVIELGSTVKDGAVVFFVRDNGVGFDMSHAERIFSPFVRLHSDQEFKGAGIGLAIVKRIVEKHGGAVWAEGEKDKGATIYFRLE